MSRVRLSKIVQVYAYFWPALLLEILINLRFHFELELVDVQYAQFEDPLVNDMII